MHNSKGRMRGVVEMHIFQGGVRRGGEHGIKKHMSEGGMRRGGVVMHVS